MASRAAQDGDHGDQTARVCIYCLRRLDAKEFNREHVLSEAFGAFRQAPVLHYCVCRECNQFFGDQLEVRFARGAFEGMLRYETGVKTPPEGAINLQYVELSIPDGNGDWSGVRLELMKAEDGLRVGVVPQAAFFDQSKNRWVHFTADAIDRELPTELPEFRKSRVRIYARSPQETNAIVSKLSEQGVNFQKAGDLELPESLRKTSEIEVEVTFIVNKGIRRCIAKYAFNHLAFVCGSLFVRGADFDVVRRFVRYGDEPPYPLFVQSHRQILYDDRPACRQTNGHLLALSWTGFDLVSEVSLFNYITYGVSLCRRFSGLIWRPIRNGIHYDVEKMIATPLVGFSKVLAP